MGFRAISLAFSVLVATLVAVPIASIDGSGAEDEGQKDWTIMMYCDINNSLEFCTEFALVDLESIDCVWIYEVADGETSLIEEWDEMDTSDPSSLKQYDMKGYAWAKQLVYEDIGLDFASDTR